MLTSFERMKPDVRLPINQTKVSTIPSYQSAATLTLGESEFVRSRQAILQPRDALELNGRPAAAIRDKPTSRSCERFA
jgi:hypothetical protein